VTIANAIGGLNHNSGKIILRLRVTVKMAMDDCLFSIVR